jgi:hypothetical protein
MAVDDLDPICALLDLWEQLETRERHALLIISSRLLAGQKQYGPLSPGKKNWQKEAFEECCDLAVYMAAGLVDYSEKDGKP